MPPGHGYVLPETTADIKAEGLALADILGYTLEIRDIPDETLKEKVEHFENSILGRIYMALHDGMLPLKYQVMKAAYEGNLQQFRGNDEMPVAEATQENLN